MRERIIERYLGSKLPENWLYLKQTGIAGIPDRLIVGDNGFVAWVELKQEDGKLSKIQEYRIKQLKDLGHFVVVLWSKKDVDKFIGGIL